MLTFYPNNLFFCPCFSEMKEGNVFYSPMYFQPRQHNALYSALYHLGNVQCAFTYNVGNIQWYFYNWFICIKDIQLKMCLISFVHLKRYFYHCFLLLSLFFLLFKNDYSLFKNHYYFFSKITTFFNCHYSKSWQGVGISVVDLEINVETITQMYAKNGTQRSMCKY